MFRQFLQSLPLNYKNYKEPQEKSSWDQYIDRQLEHLVVEYKFDFEDITKLLIGLSGENGKHKITVDKVKIIKQRRVVLILNYS